jgi:DNA-binding NarL/FixJ family response regulator
MDVRMPRLDGIEATRRVVDLPDPPRVIVLTTFDLDEYVLPAIAAGASGFLLKDAPPDEMLDAVRTVHAGDAVIAASSTRRLLRHVGPLLRVAGAAAGAPGGTRADGPAIRDRAGARRADHARARGVRADGARPEQPEIAEHFVVSEATVKTHVGRVLAKTGSRDRVQAVVLAYRLGVVRPDDVLHRARD